MNTEATLDTQQNEDDIQEKMYDNHTEEKSEWLSFQLSDLEYAVDILKVREIRIWEPCTRVPYAPGYVAGLINLRGAIVPIVDLRKRLGLEAKEYDAETVILIMDVELEKGHKTIGIVVDAISEVIETDSTNCQLSPEFDLAIEKRFVAGIADEDSSMIILLNTDTLLELEF